MSVRNVVQLHQPKNSPCQRVLGLYEGLWQPGCSGSAAEAVKASPWSHEHTGTCTARAPGNLWTRSDKRWSAAPCVFKPNLLPEDEICILSWGLLQLPCNVSRAQGTLWHCGACLTPPVPKSSRFHSENAWIYTCMSYSFQWFSDFPALVKTLSLNFYFCLAQHGNNTFCFQPVSVRYRVCRPQSLSLFEWWESAAKLQQRGWKVEQKKEIRRSMA